MIVYIAGPYSGPDYLAIDRHIAQARQAAAVLAKHGIPFFCPHLHSAHFEVITPDVPIAYWYTLDLHFLRSCTALLLLPGWERSAGSRAEKAEAAQFGMPVYHDIHTLLAARGAGEEA